MMPDDDFPMRIRCFERLCNPRELRVHILLSCIGIFFVDIRGCPESHTIGLCRVTGRYKCLRFANRFEKITVFFIASGKALVMTLFFPDCFASLRVTTAALRPHLVIASREAARQSISFLSWIASLRSQ
jgi:hypothetical protein